MKTTFLILALSLSLLSCGKQEKELNPFGHTGGKSTDKSMSEPAFRKLCSDQHGQFRGPNGNTCFALKRRFDLLTEEKNKEYGDYEKDKAALLGGLPIAISFGQVSEGAVIWGDVEDGQQVNFYLNSETTPCASMADQSLREKSIHAGALTMRAIPGNYKSFHAYVAECFTREGPAACPEN